MKKKGASLIALLCGLASAACVFMFMQHVEANAAAQRSEALERFGGDQVEVCVATRTIAAGEIADTSNVATRLWLVDLLPEKPVTNLSDIAGVQANSPIVPGEVLSYARFDTSKNPLSVPDGLQAVGLELGSAQAVGGSLKAGNMVDVYAAAANGTKCIVSNALVVSVLENSASRLAITLAVPPEHVEELIAATQTATVYLTLPSKQKGE